MTFSIFLSIINNIFLEQKRNENERMTEMRMVIKVGTSTLTYETGRLNIKCFEELCRTVSDLANRGIQVIIVSSGAIAMGVGKLRLPSRPPSLCEKQAVAAVGQSELMYAYDKCFSEYGHIVAQILMTAEDFFHEGRHANFTNTVDTLLSLGVIPIINENDSVATEEITVGDNDTLSALVAASVSADTLVLLSDIDGLYTADPRKNENAELITSVESIDDRIEAMAGAAGTERGTGGMKTKISAAKIATEAGCRMIITNGDRPADLYRIIDGESVGTEFKAVKKNG